MSVSTSADVRPVFFEEESRIDRWFSDLFEDPPTCSKCPRIGCNGVVQYSGAGGRCIGCGWSWHGKLRRELAVVPVSEAERMTTFYGVATRCSKMFTQGVFETNEAGEKVAVSVRQHRCKGFNCEHCGKIKAMEILAHLLPRLGKQWWAIRVPTSKWATFRRALSRADAQWSSIPMLWGCPNQDPEYRYVVANKKIRDMWVGNYEELAEVVWNLLPIYPGRDEMDRVAKVSYCEDWTPNPKSYTEGEAEPEPDETMATPLSVEELVELAEIYDCEVTYSSGGCRIELPPEGIERVQFWANTRFVTPVDRQARDRYRWRGPRVSTSRSPATG